MCLPFFWNKKGIINEFEKGVQLAIKMSLPQKNTTHPFLSRSLIVFKFEFFFLQVIIKSGIPNFTKITFLFINFSIL